MRYPVYPPFDWLWFDSIRSGWDWIGIGLSGDSCFLSFPSSSFYIFVVVVRFLIEQTLCALYFETGVEAVTGPDAREVVACFCGLWVRFVG